MLRGESPGRPDPTAREFAVVSTSFPPTDGRVVTEFLYEHVAPDDAVVLVTATRSLADVIQTYERPFAGPESPSLSIITTGVDYRFSDAYHDIGVFGVPGVEDLTNITIGITDLASDASDGPGEVHVVVPDLGPFLTNGVDLLARMLRSLTAHDAVTGAVVAGLEYTAHETSVVSAVHERADAIIWADELTDGSIRFTPAR